MLGIGNGVLALYHSASVQSATRHEIEPEELANALDRMSLHEEIRRRVDEAMVGKDQDGRRPLVSRKTKCRTPVGAWC